MKKCIKLKLKHGLGISTRSADRLVMQAISKNGLPERWGFTVGTDEDGYISIEYEERASKKDESITSRNARFDQISNDISKKISGKQLSTGDKNE